MIPIKIIAAFGLLLWCQYSLAQTRQAAFEMNERLGRGINIGNTFEAPTEIAWGNAWNPSYFRMIRELGFDHVRVPIRWETPERSLEAAPYTINPDFLNRIQGVVDSALSNKLHIIINMHHHDALFENPAAERERFLSQWSQIAQHFKEYPDSLLFEVLNEPHGNLTPALWNDYFSDALTEIRKTNATRTVLLGVAEYGGLGGISKLELPPDENIILTVHYYNPFSFTHQGAEWVSGADEWLGTEWLDTEADRESVVSEFSYALGFSESNNIPIHVGEFGAYSKADMESRKRWTTFLARWFEENRLSWGYWEFSAGFGIYNPTTMQYVAGLVDALLRDEMPEPTPVFFDAVYESDFSSDSDGWSLGQQGGASATLQAGQDQLNISIAAGGTEAWHVQLVRGNVLLEKDKVYRLSFRGKSQTDRSVTFYAGKASSPWNAYSSYNTVNLSTQEHTYHFTFTMTSATDAAARLVFDLGANTAAVTITEVKVEEVTFAVTSVDHGDVERLIVIYPNPASSFISIEGIGEYDRAELLDLQGRPVAIFNPANGKTLDVTRIPTGMYVLSLTRSGQSVKRRVVKR